MTVVDVPSEDLCAGIADATGDTAILSFSGGKDAIGAWLIMRRHFKRVIPFFLDLCPGLELTKKSIDYYERAFDCEIYRYTHPAFLDQIRGLVYAAPEQAIENLTMPKVTIAEIEADVRRRANCPNAYVGLGIRISDSLARRAHIRTQGTVNEKRRSFLPVWDWGIHRLVDEIRQSGIGLSDEYHRFGRTFDGIWHQYTKALDKGDLDHVRSIFPMIDADLWRAGIPAPQGPPNPRPPLRDLLILPQGTQAEETEPEEPGTVDSPIWTALCFMSRAQKNEALAAMGLADCGDHHANGYEALAVLRGASPAAASDMFDLESFEVDAFDLEPLGDEAPPSPEEQPEERAKPKPKWLDDPIKADARRARMSFEMLTSPAHFTAFCFDDEEDHAEFRKLMGIEGDAKFVDGIAVAKHRGATVRAVELPKTRNTASKAILDLVIKVAPVGRCEVCGRG